MLEVYYYDTTISGATAWNQDYSAVINTFTNNDFSAATVTGTGQWYDDSTDVLDELRFLQIGKLPYRWEEDLISEFGDLEAFSTTANNTEQDLVIGDYFLNDPDNFTTPPRNIFPDNYGTGMFNSLNDYWMTSSGVTNDAYFTVDFNANKVISGIFMDHAHHNSTDDVT